LVSTSPSPGRYERAAARSDAKRQQQVAYTSE